MSSSSDAMKAAAGSIESCLDRHATVRADHAALGKAHDNLRELHSQLRAATTDGDVAKMRALCASLETAHGEATRLHRSVADGHDAITCGLDAAALAVRGAADAAAAEKYIEPTHLDGVQTSSGDHTLNGNGAKPPRAYTVEDIRRRDQEVGVELGYLSKIRAMQRQQ